jgi:hypothetical protein
MTVEIASGEISSHKRDPTYQTGGKQMQDVNYTLERLHHFVVVSSKFREGPCLLLKDCGDGLDGITIFKLPSKRMFDQFHACLLFIVTQGGLEERLKHRARRVTHITGGKGRRNMATSRGLHPVSAGVSK